MSLLFKTSALCIFAVFVFYVFDIRHKPGMVPLVRPIYTLIMKVLSLAMMVTYLTATLSLQTVTALDWAALGATALGAGLVAAAKLSLGRYHTWTGFHLERTTIVQSGIYRYLRHPLYTGVILFELGGLAVVLPRFPARPAALLPLFLATVAYLMAFNVLMARRESQQMARKFGPAFEAYRRAVPAFLPLSLGRPGSSPALPSPSPSPAAED